MPTNILIADRHPAIRIGVRKIYSNEFPNVQFGEGSNAAELFQELKETDWDILILDDDLPGGGVMEILKKIKAEKYKPPVLLFSFRDDQHAALKAIKLGASGYISKAAPNTELVKAIHKVVDGKKYISAAMSEKFLDKLDHNSTKEPHELLSEREYQTMLLIAAGNTISEIAGIFFLSAPTISTYRARLLQKMKLKNNAELTAYVISQKLLSPDHLKI